MKESLKVKWVGFFYDIIWDESLSINEQVKTIENTLDKFEWQKEADSLGYKFRSYDYRVLIRETVKQDSIAGDLWIEDKNNPFDKIANQLSELMIDEFTEGMLNWKIKIPVVSKRKRFFIF